MSTFREMLDRDLLEPFDIFGDSLADSSITVLALLQILRELSPHFNQKKQRYSQRGEREKSS